jgi:hypothetical protein
MKRNMTFGFLLYLLVLPGIAQATQQDYTTAYNYTVQFFPRWFTWTQSSSGQPNRLVGPASIGPDFKLVVAVNDDTLYASSFLDLTAEPQVVTIPAYSNIYSVIVLDVFGNIVLSASTPTATGGSYALTGPNFNGTLPSGVTPVKLPYNASILIFRIDKYSPQGANLTQVANNFRTGLQLRSLSKYQADPSGGQTILAPTSVYKTPIKTTADNSLLYSPTDFLNTLQKALASPLTQPLTAADQALIAQFNSSFNAAKQQTSDPNGGPLSDIIRGAQAALAAITDHWRSGTGPTNWIHTNNVGRWGTNYLDRAAATEFIQLGNDIQAAYYAQAFVDGNDIPLDGSLYGYTITFTKDNSPSFSRFTSLTAYTPDDVALVANPLNKYVVASYTPGLAASADGSVTIYVQATQPTNTPIANWLPVPAGPFNLVLRIYGPKGSALDGTYNPPVIKWGLPL